MFPIIVPMSTTGSKPARCPHCGKVLPEDSGEWWFFPLLIALILAGAVVFIGGIFTIADWVMGYQPTLWASIKHMAAEVRRLAGSLW